MHTTNDTTTTTTVTPEYAAAKAAAEAGHPTTCVTCRSHGWVCAYSHTPRMSYTEADEQVRAQRGTRCTRAVGSERCYGRVHGDATDCGSHR